MLTWGALALLLLACGAVALWWRARGQRALLQRAAVLRQQQQDQRDAAAAAERRWQAEAQRAAQEVQDASEAQQARAADAARAAALAQMTQAAQAAQAAEAARAAQAAWQSQQAQQAQQALHAAQQAARDQVVQRDDGQREEGWQLRQAGLREAGTLESRLPGAADDGGARDSHAPTAPPAAKQHAAPADTAEGFAAGDPSARSATSATAPAPAAPMAPAPPPAATTATRSAQPPLVLVADDSKVVRVKTGRLLAQHGYRVALAEDGAEAAALLEAEVPLVLVTDVEMPGLDGFALARHVRQHPRAAQLPIIMITAADDRLKAAAAAAGVTLVLGKPYADDALLACIRQAQAAALSPA